MLSEKAVTSNGSEIKKIQIYRLVFLYALVGIIYIYTSDHLLELLIPDLEWREAIQTYKGIGFILLTSVLLYQMIKRYASTITNGFNTILAIRQKAEQQFYEHKEAYLNLFEHSPLPMWIIEIETQNFLLVNEAACKIYGYSREEYASMGLKDIRPQEDIERMSQLFFKSLDSENFTVKEIIRHKKKNGEIILVKIKTSLLTYNGNKVRLASALDVTDEIRAQENLIEKNKILVLASEIAGLGYWTNNLQDGKITWSEQLYHIFEQDPETFELNLENIAACFHPEDRLAFSENFQDKMMNGAIYESERRIITPSGNIKWILERMYMSVTTEGIPVKLQGIAVDITRRKLHERELHESNERFKLLSSATIEAVIDWDIANKKIFWGEGFHSIFGYDISENTSNRLWMDNIYAEDKENVLKELNDVLYNPDKKFFSAEYRFMCANRNIARVQHKGIMIRDTNGVAIRMVGALIDLTETLNHVHKIEMQNKALRDISWTQSHLVRAPLTNIMGLVSLIREIKDTGDIEPELLEGLDLSAEKLDAIIKDIVQKTLALEKLE